MGGENESYATNSLFALWLKFYNYTVPQVNHYPMGVYGVGVVATFTFALYVDGTGARYHWRIGVLIAICMLVSTIMLLAKPYHDGVVFAAQYIAGTAYAGQATFFAWANVICANDLEERAIVLASMNMFSNAVNAWWSILFYGADTAPKFRKGCYAMLATVLTSAATVCAIRYLQIRENSQQQPLVGEEMETDSKSKHLVRSTSVSSGQISV
jgi:ACS family pantothenate transporter-like MFS transporter